MNHQFYSIERDHVDSVFFPVVPDSFMKREGTVQPVHHRTARTWIEEIERPIIAAGDPWSF